MDLLRGLPAAVAKANEHRPDELVITPMAAHETLTGIFFRGSSPAKLDSAFRFLAGFKMLHSDLASCVNSAQMSAALRKAGKEVGTVDLLIVGAMLSNDCDTIITRDTDFKRIKGITVETY